MKKLIYFIFLLAVKFNFSAIRMPQTIRSLTQLSQLARINPHILNSQIQQLANSNNEISRARLAQLNRIMVNSNQQFRKLSTSNKNKDNEIKLALAKMLVAVPISSTLACAAIGDFGYSLFYIADGLAHQSLPHFLLGSAVGFPTSALAFFAANQVLNWGFQDLDSDSVKDK